MTDSVLGSLQKLQCGVAFVKRYLSKKVGTLCQMVQRKSGFCYKVHLPLLGVCVGGVNLHIFGAIHPMQTAKTQP